MCVYHILDMKLVHRFVFFWQAARLTAAARHFKQKSLQTRVFGYPSASQLDLDSFVLFTHSADMKVCHWLSCNFFLFLVFLLKKQPQPDI